MCGIGQVINSIGDILCENVSRMPCKYNSTSSGESSCVCCYYQVLFSTRQCHV